MIIKDLSKVFLNFIVFVLVQTIFFYSVVSEFVIKVIQSKTKSLSGILIKNLNKRDLNILKGNLERDINRDKDKFNKATKVRGQDNKEFLIEKLKWLFLGGVLAFGITFGFSLYNNCISGIDLAVFLVIIFSYATEILIFFVMFNRYEFIGTQEIVKIINKQQ